MQVTRELSEVELSLPAGDEVIIEESDSSAAYVALMTALPFGLAAAWMLLVARSSQRTGEPSILKHLQMRHCLANPAGAKGLHNIPSDLTFVFKIEAEA